MANVNKTRNSCSRVKVQVDLFVDFPMYVKMDIVNYNNKESRIEQVKIKYDFLLKYFKGCKLTRPL